jgi:hypothetical protein
MLTELQCKGLSFSCTTESILPVPTIRQLAQQHQSYHDATNDPITSFRLAAATHLSLLTGAPGKPLEPLVRQLMHATQVDEAKTLAATLVTTAEEYHQAFLAKRLLTATARASRTAGFDQVDLETTRDGLVRVVATRSDSICQEALVSEMRLGVDEVPAMITEVIGVEDGTCHSVMNLFDGAMARYGVVCETATRIDKGGACSIFAAPPAKPVSRPRTLEEDKDLRRQRTTRGNRIMRSKHKQGNG